MLKRGLIVALLLLALLHAEQVEEETAAAKWSLKFEDYPVTKTFAGRPLPPILKRSGDRYFRTAIREGAKKGPNFAGHFTVAEWGCGAGCLSFVLLDAETGKIFDAPFGLLSVPWLGTISGRDYQGTVFRLKSNLLIADGCPDDRNCGTHFYVWSKNRFSQIKYEYLEPAKK